MGVADGVDIMLFHQADIFHHQFAADGAAQLRMFVAVGSFDQCRNAVYAEAAVFDLGGTETYAASGQFRFFSTGIFQREDEGVEVGMFRAPGGDSGKGRFFESDAVIFSGRDVGFFFQDGFAIGIFQSISDAGAGIGFACNLNVEVEDTVFIGVLVEGGDYFVIGNILLRRAV